MRKRSSLLGGQSITCIARVATTYSVMSGTWGAMGRKRLLRPPSLADGRQSYPSVDFERHTPACLLDTPHIWRSLSAAGHDRHRSMAGLAGIWVHLGGFVVPPAELGGIRRIRCTYFHGNKPPSLRTLRDRQRQPCSAFYSQPCSLFRIPQQSDIHLNLANTTHCGFGSGRWLAAMSM